MTDKTMKVYQCDDSDLYAVIAVERMMLNDHNRPLKCFGLTKLGDPRHPLMLPYSTPLEEFVP